MKLILNCQGLLTSKISAIRQPQTQKEFMRDHFTVPKSQYDARYLRLELLALDSLKMSAKAL
jgi:hypothetical protein